MTSVSLLADEGVPFEDAAFANASAARLYEFLLGGCENYEPDRTAAYAVQKAAPWLAAAARSNRAFALGSVETSLGLGVRQFLDLGCGLPGPINVHEIVAGSGPVVYVDRDPIVYTHARCSLDNPGVTVIQGDLLAMDQLLTCEALNSALDLDEPVAVLLHDVLPWCTDDVAVRQAMAVLRAWMPASSTLSISHLTDHWHLDSMPAVVDAYDQHGLYVRPRSRSEILDLFGGFVQQRHGLAATGLWHDSAHPVAYSAAFAGIAVKPASPALDAAAQQHAVPPSRGP